MLTLRGHHQPGRCDSSKGITPTPPRLGLTPHAQSRTALTLHLASMLSRAPDRDCRAEQRKGAKQPLLSAARAAPQAARVGLATPPRMGLTSLLQRHHLKSRKGLPGQGGAGILQSFQSEGNLFRHGNRKVKTEEGSLKKTQ